jgi:uncharacterized membrane protein
VLFDQLELLRQEMNEALSQGAMAEASLDDWERTVIRYGRATRDRPASVLIADLGTDLAELKRALNHHRSASAHARSRADVKSYRLSRLTASRAYLHVTREHTR